MTEVENFLKQYRPRSTEYNESTARIFLPFHVQNPVTDQYNLNWTHGTTRVIYVELRGYEELYNAVSGDSASEICQLNLFVFFSSYPIFIVSCLFFYPFH